MKGRSHNLNKVAKYEGNAIALKILAEGVVVERREERLKMTVQEYLDELFGSELAGKLVLSHNVAIDLSISLKELL